MLGIELKFKDRVLRLPPEAGPVVVIRNNSREQKAWLDVGLYHPPTDKFIWWTNEESLAINDKLEINIKEIDFISLPMSEQDFQDSLKPTKEESDKKILDLYYELKEKLKANKLI